ncbi:MAG TPA: hypothetical protein P5193_09205, partial [Microthrixaceae bacterium]|nr:hypothetical protein [Microthrixaceae bacterium]
MSTTADRPDVVVETPSAATDLAALDSALERLRRDGATLEMSETEAEEQAGYHVPAEEGVGDKESLLVCRRLA